MKPTPLIPVDAVPEGEITAATLPRSLPCAASTEAAPSVGPTQGLQTAPSSRPSRNCPRKPLGESFASNVLPQLLTPPVAKAKRFCSEELSSTTPRIASMTAEAVRNTSPSSPME